MALRLVKPSSSEEVQARVAAGMEIVARIRKQRARKVKQQNKRRLSGPL